MPLDGIIDEIDILRGSEYALLAVLLGAAPNSDLLSRVASLRGDATALGMAHLELADAARAAEEVAANSCPMAPGIRRAFCTSAHSRASARIWTLLASSATAPARSRRITSPFSAR